MEDQSVERQDSDALKITSVVCVVAGLALSWVGTASGIGYIPGMALGVAFIACAAIVLCRKSIAFGILMIFVGLIATGVAESECNYLMNKSGQGHPVERPEQIRIPQAEGIKEA